MLTYLGIKDFALIESLELEPGSGLTVLTGETGAGKSIILAAVNLLLGQRAKSDLIRQGAQAAVVEAAFSLDEESPLHRILAEQGFEDLGDELILRRVVSRQGRNRVQVNGALATLGLLARIGPELISVCGQHSQQELLRAEEHLALLDAFAGLENEQRELAHKVARVRQLDQRLRDTRRRMDELARRRELLEHTVQELEKADLRSGEEEELRAERKMLANAEQVARLARGAHLGLYGAEEGSVLEGLGRVRDMMQELAGLDQRARDLAQQVEEAYYLLEDAAHEIRNYQGRLVFDPGRLDQVEARLHAIQRLSRKYGGEVEDALQTLQQARAELADLDGGKLELAGLEKKRRQALEAALQAAAGLGQKRRRAAPELARALARELAELGLAQCRFQCRFLPPAGRVVETPQGPLGSRGLERAEFLIAPNPGEGFRPLKDIASGGELSRMLLALKGLVARRLGAATQVFDEVDAGIGGAAGSAVGRKLARLARSGQVICITHLPQIAAFAQTHFAVQKTTRAGRTVTQVRRLDQEQRIDELTRMLAGDQQQDTARRHARELLASTGQSPVSQGPPALE